MTFDQSLKRLMLRKGLSQADIARRMGVGRTCVHQWYWGVNEPSIEKLRMLKRILGCSWDELLGDDDSCRLVPAFLKSGYLHCSTCESDFPWPLSAEYPRFCPMCRARVED